MQHPTPPPVEPLYDRPQFSLSRERRRKINDDLRLPQAGLAVAVNHPPGHRKPHLTIVKLPRANSGKPPRRGVHIPLPAAMQRGRLRVSKHARQQCRDGKFGNKGKATIARKVEMLQASNVEMLVSAVKRAAQRVSACCVENTESAFRLFNEAFARARRLMSFEFLKEASRA